MTLLAVVDRRAGGLSKGRTLIDPKGDKRLIRRNTKSQIKESDDLGRFLAVDVRQPAKKVVPPLIGWPVLGHIPTLTEASRSTAKAQCRNTNTPNWRFPEQPMNDYIDIIFGAAIEAC